MRSTVAVIDFGTSKISTLITENNHNQRCDIIGAGVINYHGYCDGEWMDSNNVNEALAQSIAEAEKQSKRKITEIYVGIPGAFATVLTIETSISIQVSETKITYNHVNKLIEQAKKSLPTLSGPIIYSSPAWFMVDGSRKTLEPVGKKGSELRGLISFVVADPFFIEDVASRFRNLNIEVVGSFCTCTAEALLYLSEIDRDRMAVLIDVGYLNTNISIVEGDALLFLATLPIGGAHISAQLASELQIHFDQAEQIKREYIYSVANIVREYSASTQEGYTPNIFTQQEIANVLEPVVDNLAEQIKKTIKNSNIKLGSYSKYFLTGGGIALNRGGKDYLAMKLKPAELSIVEKRTNKLSSPAFSSIMGLTALVMDTLENNANNDHDTLSKIKNFFNNLFGI